MGSRAFSMSRVSSSAAICFVVIALGFVGCREASHLTTGDMPPATSNVLASNQFDDIPVPNGFVLETEPVRSLSFTGSYIYQTPEYREGRLLYTGSAEPAKILDFYRSQMVLPVNGWKNVADGATAEGGHLEFEKTGSRSKLQVFQSGKSTYVLIEVSKAHEG